MEQIDYGYLSVTKTLLIWQITNKREREPLNQCVILTILSKTLILDKGIMLYLMKVEFVESIIQVVLTLCSFAQHT